MTCRQAQHSLADLCDTAASHAGATELRAHLDACEHCARAYAETRAALAAIEPPLRIQASPDFKERVMNEIAKVPAPARRRFSLPKLAFAAAAAAALVLLAPLLTSRAVRNEATPAVTLLAQSAEAMSALDSVHMIARTRTLPNDNFEYIDVSHDWVPLEIWKQFGRMPRWRVEKPGRVAVMDGVSSLMWTKPDSAIRAGTHPGFLEWLAALLDTGRLMENELQYARDHSLAATLTQETRNGVQSLVLTVDHKPKGVLGILSNDWLKNKFVSGSDHTRVYRFDPATKRLEAMQIVVHTGTADVSVFEITAVRYNETVDPALFTLTLPANVSMYVPPQEMPTGSRPLPNSAKEAAQTLFEAFAKQDWEAALVVYPASSIPQSMKHDLGGLQVISLGEPFQAGFGLLYRGWFVPYEIKLASGRVKKHNLAVRNDNPAKRWMFDGGL